MSLSQLSFSSAQNARLIPCRLDYRTEIAGSFGVCTYTDTPTHTHTQRFQLSVKQAGHFLTGPSKIKINRLRLSLSLRCVYTVCVCVHTSMLSHTYAKHTQPNERRLNDLLNTKP